jgi:hypothetical protein
VASGTELVLLNIAWHLVDAYAGGSLNGASPCSRPSSSCDQPQFRRGLSPIVPDKLLVPADEVIK